MTRFASIVVLLTAWTALPAFAQEDPGKASIGKVSVSVYYGTNSNPDAAGKHPVPSAEAINSLHNESRLKFKHYRLLGEDTKDLLRSYESWAEPLKPSDEIMVRFEAQGTPTKNTAILDLELWIARKKTIKTDAKLEGHKPLLVLGPEWRGGHLIISVALAKPAKQ